MTFKWEIHPQKVTVIEHILTTSFHSQEMQKSRISNIMDIFKIKLIFLTMLQKQELITPMMDLSRELISSVQTIISISMKEIYLLVNGISVPTQPIKMDVASKDYHHVFLDKLKLKNSNESIGISANDWIGGSFLWIADLNVDKCSNFHEHRSHPGTIHLKMQTKSSISENVRLIVYSSSRERFTIDSKTGDVLSTLSM